MNDCGLVLGSLNLNRAGLRSVAGSVSRGRIIPMLAQAMSAIDAANHAQVDLRQFSPFRLIAVDHLNLAEISFDGIRAQVQFHSLCDAAMFTSSGLGDHLVEQPRPAV